MADAEQCPLWLLAHNRRVNPTRVTSLGRVVVARGLRAIVRYQQHRRATLTRVYIGIIYIHGGVS